MSTWSVDVWCKNDGCGYMQTTDVVLFVPFYRSIYIEWFWQLPKTFNIVYEQQSYKQKRKHIS